jgi:hypothetical protein
MTLIGGTQTFAALFPRNPPALGCVAMGNTPNILNDFFYIVPMWELKKISPGPSLPKRGIKIPLCQRGIEGDLIFSFLMMGES